MLSLLVRRLRSRCHWHVRPGPLGLRLRRLQLGEQVGETASPALCLRIHSRYLRNLLSVVRRKPRVTEQLP